MAWTFTEFKSFLQFRCGNDTDLTTAGPSDANLYGILVNAAHRELSVKKEILGGKLPPKFPGLDSVDTTQSTTDGTAYIDVPSTAHYIEDVYDVDTDAYLDVIPSWREYIRKTGRATESSRNRPTHWLRRGSYIYLWPTPDDAYNLYVYFVAMAQDMSDDDDESDLGEAWDGVLLELAVYKAYAWLRDQVNLEVAANEFKRQVSEICGVYERETKAIDGRRRIKVHPNVKRRRY